MPRRPSFIFRSAPLLWVLAPLSALPAQMLPDKELPPPSSTLKDGLKSIAGLRELADGRVLVVDSVGERLVTVDLSTGKVETKMKAGTEEDEFRVLSPLWAWPGDSVAAADLGKGRLTIFQPDGAPARTLRFGGGGAAGGMPGGNPVSVAPAGRAGGAAPGGARGPRGPIIRYLSGTDRAIAAGTPARPLTAPNPGTPPARAPFAILRLSLRTMRPDTVAQLMGPQLPRSPLTNNQVGTFNVFVATTPLQALDTWAAMSDGTVAVIRAASYRIEWYAPNGERTVTDSVPYTPIPVTNNDKKRVMEDYKAVGGALLAASPQRTAILAVTYSEPPSWPALNPPFRGDIVPQVDPDDRIWLATRCASDDGALCYDVIDRTGERVARYRLPPKTRVAGFGKGAVYTAFEQKSDKELLQRHPLN
jgi:hypothetical protein